MIVIAMRIFFSCSTLLEIYTSSRLVFPKYGMAWGGPCPTIATYDLLLVFFNLTNAISSFHAALQILGLYPTGSRGVHFNTPPEYSSLQHPLRQSELDSHSDQSPRQISGFTHAAGVGGGVKPPSPMHNSGLYPTGSRGVHLDTPPEYIELQHPLAQSGLVSHSDHSPRQVPTHAGVGDGEISGIGPTVLPSIMHISGK